VAVDTVGLPAVGLGCAALPALSSSVAGTFTEAVLKGGSRAAAARTAPGAAPPPPPPPPSLWLADPFLSFWEELFGAVTVLLQVGVAAGGAGGAARGCVGGGFFGASFACMLRPSTGLVAPHSPHLRRPLTLLPPPSGPLFAPSLIARTVHWRGEPMEPFRRLLFFAGTPTLPSFHSPLGRPDAGPMAVALLPPAPCTSTPAEALKLAFPAAVWWGGGLILFGVCCGS
jgi:hypothetical protein